MRSGIAIDAWKFSIFERRLNQAGFNFEKKPGVTIDSLLLTVESDNFSRLAEVINAANSEAKLTGKKWKR
jgi:hypothetical protein